MSVRCLPRRERRKEDAVERVLSFFDRSERDRTFLNLLSFEKLEVEVKAAYLRVAHDKSWTFGVNDEDPFGYQERSSKKNSLWRRIKYLKALRIRETFLTEEFRSALDQCRDETFIPFPWWDYEQFRRVRHTWDEYLRSNLDWDVDTARFLEKLFDSPL